MWHQHPRPTLVGRAASGGSVWLAVLKDQEGCEWILFINHHYDSHSSAGGSLSPKEVRGPVQQLGTALQQPGSVSHSPMPVAV